MRSFNSITIIIICSLCSSIIFTSCSKKNESPMTIVPVIKPDIVFFGVTASNQLIKYNAKASATAIANTTITGLQTGENILAIDFRPATG